MLEVDPVGPSVASPSADSVAGASLAQSAHAKWRGMSFLIGLMALAVAHLPLLSFAPGADRAEGIEGALFEPTTASPGLVMLCWVGLLVLRWPRLRGFEGRESPAAGVLVVMLGSGICLWAHYTAVVPLLVVSLGVVVLGTGLMLGGVGAFRTLLFPCVFLLLALPVPVPLVNAIMYPLQLANAAAVGVVLSAIGLNPFVSGDLVLVGDRVFQVIEGCSGLRTILIVTMSACLFTQLAWHDSKRTLVLIMLAPIIGAVTNHIRILTIIFNPAAAFASVHTAQGIAMIVIAVIMIGLVDFVLARVWKTPATEQFPVGTPTGLLPRGLSVSYAVVCVSLAISTLGIQPWRPLSPPLVALTTIGGSVPGWQVKGTRPDLQFAGSIRYDEFISHEYTSSKGPGVDLFVAGDTRLDPMLGIGSTKTLIPTAGGVVLDAVRTPGVPIPGLEVAVVRAPGAAYLVYHWKVGLDSLWVETAWAVLGLDRSPFRRTDRAAFVRLSTVIERLPNGLAAADERLRALTEDLRGDFVAAGVWPKKDS
jgi:exosortase